MTPYVHHPAIALRDSLSARGVTVSADNNALKVYPRTGLDADDQPAIQRWATVLAALSQDQDVWLVWDSGDQADALMPVAATPEGWDRAQRTWLQDDQPFTERSGWIRMQWWHGTALWRDAYLPTVGRG